MKMILPLLVIIIVIAGAFLLTRTNMQTPDSGMDNKIIDNMQTNMSDNQDETGSGFRTNSDGELTEHSSREGENEENRIPVINENRTKPPAEQLVPPRLTGGGSGSGSGSGDSGGSGSGSEPDNNYGGTPPWYVPEPYIPDPSIAIFTTPPAPLDELTIYAFDVGGDSYFIDTSADDVLADAGSTTQDAQNVLYLMGELNKTMVDIIVTSNHNPSHLNGIVHVLNNIDTNWVFDSGSNMSNSLFFDYLALAEQKNFSRVRRGNIYEIAPDVRIEVLHPARILPEANESDNSIVFRLTYGGFVMLFTGDCQAECENDILASGADLRSDVLKVSSRGSSLATSQEFWNAVNATSAIITVNPALPGQENLPDPAVLSRLATDTTIIYRTDLNGNIIVTTNGVSYQVLTQK